MQYSRTLLATTLALALIVPSVSIAEESTGATTATETSGAPLGAPMKDRMLMKASGTPSVSPQMKNMMEKRDALHDKTQMLRASGTPPFPKKVASGTPPLRDKMASGTPGLPGKMRERMDEAKERMGADRIEQMKKFARVTFERMRAAIARLEKIAERIDSRITKLKTEGIDTSLAEAALAKAKQHIAAAKAALEEAKAKLSTYTPSASSTSGTVLGTATGTPLRPQPGMGQPSPLRDAFKKVEEEIRAAHKALVEALKALKAVAPKHEGNGTTTPTVPPTPPATTTATGTGAN